MMVSAETTIEMDRQGSEVQDHFSVEDSDTFAGSPDMDLDSNDDLFCEMEVKIRGGNGLGDKLTEAVDPQIGMEFNTINEAYNFYNGYARMMGFNTRKKRSNRSTVDRSKILRYTVCCACEGSYTKIKTPTRRREDRRFGCMAEFSVKLIKNGKYKLVEFVAEHTHDLVPLSSAQILRLHRDVKTLQDEVITYFCEEAGGAEYVKFNNSDSSNMIQRRRADILKREDVLFLLNNFRAKKRENRHFSYSFRTNDESEICGVFFCDATSRRDYGLFGDTLSFDTTFGTKNYNMICTLFVGINNHGQTTLFGCGLVDSERTDSFVWLLSTFLEAVGGRQPKTIFTGQGAEIENAVGVVFPDSHHRLCLRSIHQNTLKNLKKVFSEFKSFSERFKECIYEGEIIEEFELTWAALIKDFNLEGNEWLQRLYDMREKWAQVYAHVHFCADMPTIERSESINEDLKRFFGTKVNLQEFVDQYGKAIATRRQIEREEFKRNREGEPILLSNWSVEHEAATIYPRKIFKIFQEEYKKTLDLRIRLDKVDGDVNTYIVEYLGSRHRNHTLTYHQSEKLVLCTCRKFEFQGILCSHTLKLFRDLNFLSLPSTYYMKRWTKSVIDEVVFDSYGEAIRNDNDPLSMTRYKELSCISQIIVAKGAKSSALCSLAKSELLQLEANLDALAVTEDERTQSSSSLGDSSSVLDKDAPLRESKRKKILSQSKKGKEGVLETKAAKRTSSKQNGDGKKSASSTKQIKERENSVNKPTKASSNLAQGSTIQQAYNHNPSIMGLAPNVYQPVQEHFVLAHGSTHHHSFNQIQNQVPGIFPPYQFFRCPEPNGASIVSYNYPRDQRNRLILPRPSISQWASPSQTNQFRGPT